MKFWPALSESSQTQLHTEIQAINAFCDETTSVPYLLLDRGDENPLQVDTSRLLPVPDPCFEETPWLAPQLLPLVLPGDKALLQDALAAGVLMSTDRSAVQWIGAVVLAPADPFALLDHLARLGIQHDPGDDAAPARLFRYQDPRVMQRVWPLLGEPQRRAWMGPVRRWQAAVQPTGRIVKDVSDLVALWCAAPAAASRAVHARLGHLLDVNQWRLAHSAPTETTFWQSAPPSQGTTPAAESFPSTGTLRYWLHDAARQGLGDRDQAGWALCHWMAGQDYSESPAGQRRAQAALALQHDHAGLDFATAWRTAGQSA